MRKVNVVESLQIILFINYARYLARRSFTCEVLRASFRHFLNFKRLFLMKLLRPMVRLLLLSLRVFNLTNMCRARYAATLVATSVLLFLHVPLYYRTGKEFMWAENNSGERLS